MKNPETESGQKKQDEKFLNQLDKVGSQGDKHEGESDICMVRFLGGSVLGSEEAHLVPLPITDDRDTDYIDSRLKQGADLVIVRGGASDGESPICTGHSPWITDARRRLTPEAAAETKRPCGECHLNEGEVCDICAASLAPALKAQEGHKSEHWYDPSSGQIECECCCGAALDAEVERKKYADLASLAKKLDAALAKIEDESIDHRAVMIARAVLAEAKKAGCA